MSPFSPGTVQDVEQIIRVLLAPKHFDPSTGELNETAFDAVMQRGLSTLRESHMPPDGVKHQAKRLIDEEMERAKKNGATPAALVLTGFGVFKVDVLRTLRNATTGNRAFCILDTALEHCREHADIFMERPENQSKADRSRLRKALFESVQIHTL